MNGQRGLSIERDNPPMPWLYPELMGRQVESPVSATFVILETDASAAPRPRYTQALIDILQGSDVFGLHVETPATGDISSVQRICNFITPYNHPSGFRVCRKRAEDLP